MTTFSVWNVARKVYDYYESRHPAPDGPPNPAHLKRPPALGMSPARAAWPLPSDARLVGRGPYARGAVAEHPSNAMGDDVGGPNWVGVAGFGAAAWLLWQFTKKGHRR